MFRVTGELADDPSRRRRTVTWKDGELGGDPEVVKRVRARAERLEGTPVGPPDGPLTRTRHLQTPTSASILLAAVFTPGTVALTGDLPEQPLVLDDGVG